jgi:hypothetical protein
MNITNMLKGIGGEPELIRTLGGVGVLAYIFGGIGFQAWNMSRGVAFDVVAFCAAFPAGLGVAIGAAAGAVALKDRNVAEAKKTQAATDTVDQANEAAKP